MQNLYIKTFGCKVNQYNSELLSEQLVNLGDYQLSQIDQADIVILNSCVVTNHAEQELVRNCRKYVGLGKKVYVTGCVSKSLQSGLMETDIVCCNSEDLLERLIGGFDSHLFKDFTISSFQNHTRAFVKIQSGCNQFCSYCIVPYVRGVQENRTKDTLIEEIHSLSKNGYKEIVLTGTQIGLYADPERENYFLIDLMKDLEMTFESSLNRIRLSSIGPTFITLEMIDFLSKSKLFCNHLHISLQSGSNRILEKMNRKYSAEEYLALTNRLKESIKDISISTDIIVGFPGEEEIDFQKTDHLLQKIQFSKIHVFPFSSRDGTAASTFSNPVLPAIIKKRTKSLLELSKLLSYNVKRGFIGRKVEVLVEDNSSGFSRNYLRVVLQKGIKTEKGQVKEVFISRCDSEALYEKN